MQRLGELIQRPRYAIYLFAPIIFGNGLIRRAGPGTAIAGRAFDHVSYAKEGPRT